MSAFVLVFIVLEVIAAALLAGIVFLLAKPKQKALTNGYAEEETATAVSSGQTEENETDDEIPLSDTEEPADEITTDDGESDEPVEIDTAPAETAATVVTEVSSSPESYRLAKSFTAKLILSDDILKERYSEIKNALLSYKKVKARTSWKCETYRCGRTVLAKLAVRGKKLCLYLALTAEDITDSKYKVESANRRKPNTVTPTVYKIRNALRVKHAKQLIAILAQKHALIPVEREPENFAPAYRSEEELIAQGLIRKVKGNNAFIRK